MDLGCGITFDIFTHVFTRVVFKIYYNIHTKKKDKLTIWTRDIMLSSYKTKDNKVEKERQVDDLDEGYNVVELQNKR